MKKAFVALLLLALTSMSMVAQIPSGYYDNASGKTGTELRQALHDIIDNHTQVSYANIWNAFWGTDNKGNGVVWDMYSDIPGGTPPYTYYIGQNQCGSYNSEGDCYNREHSWPKSWFNGSEKSVPGHDLHHIFPTDGYVNAGRSNYPYGEVRSGSGVTSYQNGSKLGPCKSSLGYSGTVFEPIDEYKGDFARAYFYMCTRYYGEDFDWGSSDMTTKANLKDWAVTMLLRWSDNDPVSQKEIDRNNVIYSDYQHNRNPFIDHSEYARMIWDPNYQNATTYNIACVQNIQHGSVSAPTTAVEGSTVNLTATPDAGYMLGSWDVYKTGASGTKVTVTSNSFVMPAYDVTVSASFTVNTTQYAITCATGLQHGSVSANYNTAQSGTTITLSNTHDSGYTLYSYYVYETGNINNIVYSGTGNTFTMPAFNVTVSASFAQGSGDYVKVTSAPSDWSGEYLIVYEGDGKAFNGALTSLDVSNNTISVTITGGNTIVSNSTTNAAKFTIAPMTNGYSIQAASGKYIGNAGGSNGLTSNDSPMLNTLSMGNDGVNIVGAGGTYLRFNNATSEQRFRYFKSSTYTQQQPIQLYKKTSGSASVPTHTIHFYLNDGSQSSYTQTVNEFEPTALNANIFTRQGYAFDSWNTAANGSGTTYFDGAMVSLLGDLTLYAQWDPTYGITCASVQNGSISANLSEAVEGTLVTLTAEPASGYELEYWTVAAENEEPVEVVNNSFVMPGCAVTVNAVFVYVGVFAPQYYLVTSTDQLVADRTYLIVNSGTTGAAKALSKTQNTNNRGAADVNISAENGWPIIASIASTNACELTLGGAEVNENACWTFYDAGYTNNNVTGGYLYAASSSANQLKTKAALDDNGKWAISFDNDGKATITAQGSNTRNIIRYNPNTNNGDPLFACYGSSTQQDVYLFIKGKEFDHPQSESITHLLPSDKHTVHSGATLTVTGTATNVNPSHIILKDGAQLVHYDDNVQATIKKTIVAYTPGTKNGWHLIGYSFARSGEVDEMDNLLANEYDLYYYDEPTHYWMNQELAANSFTELEAAKGYLYANSQAQTVGLKGTLKTANATVNVPLDYTETAGRLKGFNLVGNPFAHNVTTYTGTNVAANCYRMNGNGTDLMVDIINGSNPLKPGEGFFVKATDAEASITFNPGAKDGAKAPELVEGPVIQLDLIQNGLTLDRLIVKREGEPMEKLTLRENGTKLFALRDNQEMAVVPIEGKEQPVSFKAVENGSYTISATTDDGFSYLHLIDHKTGADVDLLALRQAQGPASYTFEASEGDYATRFMLAFAPMDGPSTGSEAFAYWADGEIRLIIEAQDFASLQVIDMMGRIIRCGDGVHTVSTSGMTPGVYVLRLVTDDNVRVQKIVVK